MKTFWSMLGFALSSPLWVVWFNLIYLSEEAIETYVGRVYAAHIEKNPASQDTLIQMFKYRLTTCGCLMLGWLLYMWLFGSQIRGSAPLVLLGYPVSGAMLSLYVTSNK